MLVRFVDTNCNEICNMSPEIQNIFTLSGMKEHVDTFTSKTYCRGPICQIVVSTGVITEYNITAGTICWWGLRM